MAEAVSTQPAAALNQRRVLAGLDEVGLGPILGPMVIGGVALEGPAGGDPWRLLRRLVCRDRTEKGKVRVADSKKVHKGGHQLGPIEHTALAFVGAWHGSLPATLAELLRMLGVDPAPLAHCPWYGALELPLPIDNDPGELELLAHRLRRELEAKQIELLRLALRVVDVEEFNALIDATDNKSDTHFSAYADVLGGLLEAVRGRRGHVVADRCGGRFHYRNTLRRRWPDTRIVVIDEQPECSEYLLGEEGDETRLTFAEKADGRAFPTALASCLAKFVREAMIRCLNAWFRARLPDLEPTAGYYVDGHRFLAAVRNVPDVPWERLVRSR